MNWIFVAFIFLNLSFAKASDGNENFDDQKLQNMLNEESSDVNILSPVIEQDSLDVTISDQTTNSIDSDRFLTLERQIQNLQHQVEDLKHQLKNNTLKSSFEFKGERTNSENIDTDSSEISVFESRPALKMYEQAQHYLENQVYQEAEKLLNDIVNSYPEDPLIINAKYWLGETCLLQKKYKKAAQYFANAYEVYQNLEKKNDLKNKKSFKMSFAKAPEALVKLAYCLKLLEKKKQACLTLTQLQTEFPHMTQTVKKSFEKLNDELQCENKLAE